MTKHEIEQLKVCINLLRLSGKNTKEAVRLLLEDMVKDETTTVPSITYK